MLKSAVNNVLRRLAQRLASVRGEESCLTLTAEFAEHFLKVHAEGRSSFTGSRMNNLMLVLPYLIRDIAGQEVAQINSAIRSAAPGDPLHSLKLVVGLSSGIVDCLLTFLRWYLLIQRRELLINDVSELLVRGQEMMESLKATFPDKSAEVQAWSFGKFHDILHLLLNIILCGWIEITSGQSGEGAHRELLKTLAGCVNNKEVFMQFLRFWERLEQWARAQLEEESDSGSDLEAEAHWQQRAEKSDSESTNACENAVRCPLSFMTLHCQHLHHRVSSVKGSRLMGGQRFNVWELTHGAGDHRVTNFRSLFDTLVLHLTRFLQAIDAHQVLARLPKDLALFFIRVPQGYPGAAETSGALGQAQAL